MGKIVNGVFYEKKGRDMPTTDQQKDGVKAILSGKYVTRTEALRSVGYKTGPGTFMKSTGVQKYLKMLDVESKRRFNGRGIEDKVVDTYVEGLEATKLYGKNAIKHPDYLARKAFADKIGGMLGIGGTDDGGGDKNQYNFFMFGQEEKQEFNEAFGEFVKNQTKKSST